MGALAKEMGLPLVAKGDGYDALAALTTKLTGMGLKDLIIDTGSPGLKQALQDQIAIRRAALVAKFRPFGFPTITVPAMMTDDPMMEKLYAAVFIAKYGGIVVVNDLSADGIFPLLLERLNIYTDPQKPMIITPGIYEIGTPDENSPVAITTNFALTYFIVSGEIESSKVSTWLLIQDTEGLSVMTAWAAGKFSGDSVAHVREKMRDCRQGQDPHPHHSGLCRRHQRRPGRGTARLEGAHRASGSLPYPGLAENPVVVRLEAPIYTGRKP